MNMYNPIWVNFNLHNVKKQKPERSIASSVLQISKDLVFSRTGGIAPAKTEGLSRKDQPLIIMDHALLQSRETKGKNIGNVC